MQYFINSYNFILVTARTRARPVPVAAPNTAELAMYISKTLLSTYRISIIKIYILQYYLIGLAAINLLNILLFYSAIFPRTKSNWKSNGNTWKSNNKFFVWFFFMSFYFIWRCCITKRVRALCKLVNSLNIPNLMLCKR